MLLGVDVGGTFTDAVLLADERLHTAKAPSTPGDEVRGLRDAVLSVLERAGARGGDVSAFAHGMTVGTNALLTETGARTALVATDGFTDLLDIARQDRPRLYEPCAARPAPLVDDTLRVAVRERVGAEETVLPLEAGEVERVLDAVGALDPEAVAICLLFAYRDPAHERALAAAIRKRLPDAHVSASHEVLPRHREYERCSTTVIDAYLSPALGEYLSRLGMEADSLGLPAPVVMKSSGGVAPAAEAARSGATTVLSGPAGGAVGAALLARLSGGGNAVGIDMGGTSCDVCVITDGEVQRTAERSVGGRVIQLPMVDVHTVGAGGGSIAWRDAGGALRVGPRSAGADPGPACYGRGGEQPTVSDANLLLGYLNPDAPLAGGVELDPEAALTAVGTLAEELGLGALATAEGIVRVANQEMARAIRVVTVERGIDPRAHALLPFGGAGPLHAAALAGELGMNHLICPRAGGVLSALGLAASDRRRDTARTVMLRGDELTATRVASEVDDLRRELGGGLGEAETEVLYELRYAGQAFELAIPGGPQPDLGELTEAFAAEHERRYSYRDPDSPIELVSIRLALVEPGPRPTLPAGVPGALERGERRARFAGAWVQTAVLRGEPAAGESVAGPCVFELPEATLVLPPGWSARVDEHGTVVAEARP